MGQSYRKSSFRVNNRVNQRHVSEHSEAGSIFHSSAEELQAMPIPGSAVASMISTVVSQSATMAATAAGGKVGSQTKSTFGKRNIKNQVKSTDFM